MTAHRALGAIVVWGCVMLHSGDASAQSFATTCAKFLWDQVGKPLILDQAGGLIREYFFKKRDEGGGGERHGYGSGSGRDYGQNRVQISRDDMESLIAEYEARGLSECQLRQQLQRAMGGPAMDGPMGSAMMGRPMPQMQIASMCMTPAGTCPMRQPVPIQGSCFCVTPWGPVQGIAQ